MSRALMIVMTSSLMLPLVAAPTRPAPRKLEVAPGVFVFMTAPYGAVGLDGNSIVVRSRDGVLVFDSNGTPDAAARVLSEIRAITPQPVRYLVHSHWHWDHWYGAEVYQKAFPDLQIVAHEKTRALMAGPAIAFNRPGLERQLPDYIRSIERRLAAGESTTPPSADVPALRAALDEARYFLEQKSRVKHTLPTRTFSERLVLTLGEREVQILNFGRGVTPGDAVMYLPKERILVTGDLIVNPVTFALSGYPTEWVSVLEKLNALPADIIITGHGEPLRDKTLIQNTLAIFRTLIAEGRAARDRGLDPDQAGEAIMPSLQPLMVKITGDAAPLNAAFRTQLVDWFLHRVYDELAAPLTDAIAPIPAR